MSSAVKNTEPNATRKLLSSVLGFREQLAKRLGDTFGGRRNTYETFGYTTEVTYEEMLQRYQRQDIASRIVNAYPDAIWTRPPFIVQNEELGHKNTGLSDQFWKLSKKLSLLHYINRADRLAGLGKYSVMLIGFNDVKDSAGLVNPVARKEDLTINYLQVYGYGNATIQEYEDNAASSLFGRPKIYDLSVADRGFTENATDNTKLGNVKVHASRVLHFADSVLDNEVIGYPILERVYNRLDDAEKIVGGSAEMFWLSGRNGLHFDMHKEVQFTERDAVKLREEIEDYMNDMQRVLRTRGVTVKELGGSSINPEPVFNVVMSMISVSTGIPQRIFIGSEQGKLASEQDRANWSIRINERRKLFAEDKVLVPLINRLQILRILPEGEYELQWPQAFQMSPLERAQTAAQQARAATNIVRAMSEYAKPIEGVDYPIGISTNNTEMIDVETTIDDPEFDDTANDNTEDDNDNDNKSEDESPVVKNKNRVALANNPISETTTSEKPVNITKTKEIIIARRELITIEEARAIIFAQGELKSEAPIEGVMD
jgi:uncharacterized protein